MSSTCRGELARQSVTLCSHFLCAMSACAACALRHDGETAVEAYRAACVGIDGGGGGGASGGGGVCAVCLGILQVSTAPWTAAPKDGDEAVSRASERVLEINALSAIVQRAVDRGHAPERARIEVILPAATATRERAYAAARAARNADDVGGDNDDVPTTTSRGIVSIDNVLRMLLAPELERALGCPVDGARDGYALTLKYKYGDDAKDTAFLNAVELSMSKQERQERRGFGAWNAKKRKRGGGKHLSHLSSPEDPFAEEFDDARRLFNDATRKLANEQYVLDKMKNHTAVPPEAPRMRARCVVEAHHKPTHVGGWYMKLDRGVPQSPWVDRATGKRIGRGSVVEAIENVVLKRLGSAGAKFNSSGREDIDVRMLGAGRPFAIQAHDPKTPKLSPSDYAEMEREINENSRHTGVKVRGLCASAKEKYHEVGMNAGENEKEKSYTALVRVSRPATDADLALIASQSRLVIQQSTPTRVAHRRADLVRPRTIVSMSTDRVPGSPDTFLLHLRTQAGTYIKEFVHGDQGRTTPSLGTLLDCKADILQLDVTEIDDEWNP